MQIRLVSVLEEDTLFGSGRFPAAEQFCRLLLLKNAGDVEADERDVLFELEVFDGFRVVGVRRDPRSEEARDVEG